MASAAKQKITADWWCELIRRVHVRRWKAEYRLVPDEQDQIEAALKQLVRHRRFRTSLLGKRPATTPPFTPSPLPSSARLYPPPCGTEGFESAM